MEGWRLELGSKLGPELIDGESDLIDGTRLMEGINDMDGDSEGAALGLPVGAAVTGSPPSWT